MEIIGQVVIYVMMLFLIIGAIASIIDDTKGFGREFKEGIHSIGHIFLPVAGIMALIPILSNIIVTYVGPAYAWLHADPSLAAGMIIAGDMGGYQLAAETAGSHSAWMLAFAVSLTAGSTVIFSIPVGLSMLPKEDHRHMALGVMAGLLAIPFAALLISFLLLYSQTPLRTQVSTDSTSTMSFNMSLGDLMLNLIPLVIFVLLLALGLRFFTGVMVRLFIMFGKILDAIIKLALALSIVQYFTNVFDFINPWPLASFIADADDQFRALEVAGYIGVMLAGAFPMVYAIRTWFSRPLSALGRRIGLSDVGTAGLVAGSANILALFRIVPDMPIRDKVVTIAFAVCAGFTFGDHLAFAANFQPNMVAALIVGKLVGGIIGIALALWLSVPSALRHPPQEERLRVVST